MRRKMVIIMVVASLCMLVVPTFTLAADSRTTDKLDVRDGGGNSSNAGDNFYGAIDKIQDYINKNIDNDIYASLHLDWEIDPNGTIIVSFTQELPANQKSDLEAFLPNPELIHFRVVQFSEKQLLEKQREVDSHWTALEQEGITVRTTSVNVYTNKLEIGIEPLTETNIARLHQLFGNEIIEVVQGYEVHLLNGNGQEDLGPIAEGGASDLAEEDIVEAKKGFFQRLIEFIKSLFGIGK